MPESAKTKKPSPRKGTTPLSRFNEREKQRKIANGELDSEGKEFQDEPEPQPAAPPPPLISMEQLKGLSPAVIADAIARAPLLERVIRNKYIPFTPHPKQAIFLTDNRFEMLFGGSAGPGKSAAALMAALMYVDCPGYNAMVIRRTFADLNKPHALIPMSMEWLLRTDAKWNEQNHRWTFPSGATLSFGHCETENDKYQYQGSEISCLCVDEATHFTESIYTYIISRVRKPEYLHFPLRVRCTANPGGPGHEWVRQRFVDPASREDRIFIPAKLEDNPSLDPVEYDRSLSKLSATEYRQLRHGDWNVRPEGGVFRADWLRYYERYKDHYLLGRDRRPVAMSECSRFASADIAGTEKRDNNDPDYTVIQIWDMTPAGDMILVDQFRDRYEIPDVEEKLMSLCWQWEVPYAVVEKNGIGLGVVQTCKRRGLAVRPILAKRDKFARSQMAQLRMEAGSVYFPSHRPWLNDLEGEILSFPQKGVHDDCIDAFSIAAHEAQRAHGGPLRDKRDDDFDIASDSAATLAEAKEIKDQARLEREAMHEEREARLWHDLSMN